MGKNEEEQAELGGQTPNSKNGQEQVDYAKMGLDQDLDKVLGEANVVKQLTSEM